MSPVESVSPLRYFGSRDVSVRELFKYLLRGKHFKTIYEPFCGSANFSLLAMQLGLAKNYVISDSYKPVISTLKTIHHSPDKIIERYIEHCKNLISLPSWDERNQYFITVQNKLNNEYEAEHQTDFIFISNYSKMHVPIIEGNKNISQFEDNSRKLIEDIEFFKDSIHYTAKIFNQHTVSFEHAAFPNTLKNLSKNDLIILDPPYPDEVIKKSFIYHQPVEPNVLYNIILETIDRINSHGCMLILFYGTFDTSNHYLINKPKINHYLRLGKTSNSLYNEFIENIYLSENLSNNTESSLISFHMAPYNDLQNLSSNDIIAKFKFIENKNLDLVTSEKNIKYIYVDNTCISVTKREYNVIEYLIIGYSAKMTAKVLNISPRTVETYIDKIKQKTNCRNKVELIAKIRLQ